MISPPNQQQPTALPKFFQDVQLTRRLREDDTATPDPPLTNLPGGIIRQITPSRSRNVFDPHPPHVKDSSESGETPEPRPPPPPATRLLSPHNVARVPSNNNLALHNAGSGRCSPPTPLEIQAEKSRDILRSPSDNTVRGGAGQYAHIEVYRTVMSLIHTPLQ
jgi:hypothetical protein